MNCNDARRRLSPYLDSELGSSETFAISEHLRSCSACFDLFDAERRADVLIAASLTQEKMPQNIRDQLRRSVLTSAVGRRLRFARVLALAACLALVAFGAWQFRSTNTAPAAAFSEIPSTVATFADLTSTGDLFTPSESAPEIATVVTDLIGYPFMPSPEVLARHHAQLVSVEHKLDSNGRRYVEMRINCCGEPLLLVAGRTCCGMPKPFDGVRFDNDDTPTDYGDIHFLAKQFDGVAVMVASRHGVDGVIEAIEDSYGA